ncbi:TlpA family protein disulfide reductase [Pinibacter aurantiacus]|uniref:TlpA family protein disulfide reductase n=1 Tax=Pinibacter aurantiacus TaxID=2851599 RepID=A0A9E2S8Y8_9BACT|nr:TlpA disulfide reductase family protein [Pinibacter aurantiacus]MBV4358718.1 TlpA family protein disulfide reductase [Pinibacter aurantiacus]
MKYVKGKIALLAVLCLLGNKLFAQDVAIRLGDKAPALKYSKWLKGTPIKEYQKGRLYLFEFWATWCGPCIGSMPHLSELSKKYKNEITIVGVNIWEGSHGDTSKPYSSYLPKVSKFVNQMGDKLAYNVVMDNDAQFMGNKWMKAAGQSGIPCTFVVRDGQILWIGHPIQLDSLIQVILKGQYDVATAKKNFEKKEAESDSAMAPFTALYAAYEKAVKDGQYDKAIKLCDSGITSMPNVAGTFGFFKFQTLLDHFREDSALAFAKRWQSTKPGYVGSTAAVISRKEGLSKDSYLYAIDLSKQLMAENANMPPSICYNEMAGAYAHMGDYKTAVETQQLAIDSAKQSLKEGKFAGFILQSTVDEYEKTLANYKKNLK